MSDQVVDLHIRAKAILGEAQKQIATFTQDVEKAAESTKKKSMSIGDMAKVATAAGVAISAFAGTVTALGARGADIADLRDSFGTLNRVIGNDAVAVLATLRESFAGTRSDADLMRMANQALSAGLRASQKDFALIADAARIVSDRTGIDATQAFKALAQSMATGKTKAAELLVGVIDNDAAIMRYAVSVGKSVKDLTEHERIEAVAIATKARLTQMIEEGGRAQVDFADKVDQSKVKLENLVNNISEWVASKPEIATWSSVVTAGSAALASVALTVGPLTGLMKTLAAAVGTSGLASSFIAATGGLAGMKAAAIAAAASLGPLAAAIGLVWSAWKVGNIESVKNAIAQWSLSANDGVAQVYRWTAGIQRLTPEQARLAVQTTAAMDAIQKQADASKAAATATTDLAREVQNAETAIAAGIEQKQRDTQSLAAHEEATKKAAAAAKALNAAYNKLMSDVRNEQGLAWFKFDEMELKRIELLRREMQALAALSFNKPVQDLGLMQVELRNLEQTVAGVNFGEAVIGSLTPPPTRWDSFFNGVAATIRQGFGTTVLSAITGGGSVGEAIGSFLGKSITEGLFNKEGGLGASFQAKVSGLFGKTGMGKWMGDAIASFLPGIGSLVSSFIGPLADKIAGFFKNMFGGPDKKELEGRSVMAEFKADVEASLSVMQKLEAGTDAWKKQVVGVRDAYIKVGRTEQEALEVSTRLWAAEKEGPDAVRRVLAHISSDLLGTFLPANQAAHAVAALGWDGVLRLIEQNVSATDHATTAALSLSAAVGTGLTTAAEDAAAALGRLGPQGVSVFDVLREQNDAFRAEVSKPIVISATLLTDAKPGDREKAANMTDAQKRAMVEQFLRDNPGDYARIPAALGISSDEANRLLGRSGGSSISVEDYARNSHLWEQFPGMYDVPGAAGGGIYSKPTFRVIAESSPEVVGAPNMIVTSFMQALRGSGVSTGGDSHVMQTMCDALRRMEISMSDLPRSIQTAVRDGVLLAAAS